MELLSFPFLVQQSPLVEVGSSLPGEICSVLPVPGRCSLLPVTLSPGVPWPQPQRRWERPKRAITPLKCSSAHQRWVTAFHPMGIPRFFQGAAEPALLLSWLC